MDCAQVCGGGRGAGKTPRLPVDPRSDPHLRSRAVGSDGEHRVTDTRANQEVWAQPLALWESHGHLWSWIETGGLKSLFGFEDQR